MPALFAYLFSLLIFVGGGYAGLVWLTEPTPEAAHSTGMTMKARVHPGRAKALSSTLEIRDTARIDESDAQKSVALSTKPKNVDLSASTASKRQETSGEHGENQASFGKRDPLARENEAAETAPPKNENADLLNGRALEAVDNGNAVAKSQNRGPLGSPTNHASRIKDAMIQPAYKEKAAGVRKEAKRVIEQKDQLGDHKRIESSRGLVMMTLRTIEFSDGHREERLLPMQRRPWAERD